MIPKPVVPLQIDEAKEEKPRMLRYEDYTNNVAQWNPNTRQWEFKNGQMMNCDITDNFLAKEE